MTRLATFEHLMDTWAPGATTILIVPAAGIWVIRAYSANGDLLRLTGDELVMVPIILRGEYPGADWSQPQTWQATDGIRPTRDRLAVTS